MKAKTVAWILLLSICVFVTANAAIIDRTIRDTIGELKKAEGGTEKYERIFARYRARERWIGLTVGHRERAALSEAFAELIAATSAEDEAGAEIAKSRLLLALEEIRRLAGLRFESVF